MAEAQPIRFVDARNPSKPLGGVFFSGRGSPGFVPQILVRNGEQDQGKRDEPAEIIKKLEFRGGTESSKARTASGLHDKRSSEKQEESVAARAPKTEEK